MRFATRLRELRPDRTPDRATAQLRAEIARLTASERLKPSLAGQRELLRARHAAGISLLDNAVADPAFAAAGAELAPGDPLPAVAGAEVTPELLRTGILRDGCLLVRGLVPRQDALGFAALIDRAYDERERIESGEQAETEYYEEFAVDPRFEAPWRPWIKLGGGLLAADSPLLSVAMFELFERARLPELVPGYLGEPALLSVHKTTLRRAEPSVPGAWHQDGFFMGPARALNLWLALSRCGDEAPGLDLVPRRLDRYLTTGSEGADLQWTISEQVVDEAAGSAGVIRPIFEPGDALFFDELFLHKTGSEESMPNSRFAIESWFFGASGFPAEYAPLAL